MQSKHDNNYKQVEILSPRQKGEFLLGYNSSKADALLNKARFLPRHMFFFVSGIYRPFVVVYSTNNYYDVYSKCRIMARGLLRQTSIAYQSEAADALCRYCTRTHNYLSLSGATSQFAVWGPSMC
jgi:hypothetical protein